MKPKMAIASALFLLCLVLMSSVITAVDVSYDGRAIKINGKRKVLFSGSIHYPRSTPEMWPSLIKKAKEGGIDVIETYVFWNAHEPVRREYDFSGNLDLVRFIKTIQNEGLYAMLRLGPYVCAEWNYGGFPVWLHNIPNIELRTNNAIYEAEMKTFTTLIVNKMKEENLFASQGGPIILSQIENEYGNIMGPYGQGGVEYIQWCAQLAESFNIGVPWVMCQQSDAPRPMINTCNGFYCDQFTPNSQNSPKMWTENWVGWFKDWGQQTPHRTAEDVAFAVGRFFQYGGTFQNYYMYHGGTNFGRTSGGPYISTSYDYDAPLDEYGNLNQPKWGHLKRLHEVLKSMEETLTYGTSSNIDYGNMVSATVYSYAGKSVCFLGNANWYQDAKINFQNTMYNVPAWSVSLLPDCYKEVYNTAKVNAQTSTMVMKNDQSLTNWEWTFEPYLQMKNDKIIGSVSMTAPQLLEQKVVTNDTSDYLWYITSVDMSKMDPIWDLKKEVKIRVQTNGHGLHVFVNGLHAGSHYANNGNFQFTYEAKAKLKLGKNEISLLSGTVGLANYGSHFDNVNVGISGPVHLIADHSNTDITMDISKSEWYYKVGLHGERVQHYSPNSRVWFTNGLPTDKILVWYKTTFSTPLGSDPVVLDLKGLGKGTAWVNGNNIGRYWPSYLAGENGCSSTCDFRGTYNPNKCMTDCGKSSQRWYHVPRSFLKADGENTLVLFEELGGQPYSVKVATVTIDKICANAYEGHLLELACQENQVISDIKFASFGAPQGECGSFTKGNCESPDSLLAMKRRCLGKQRCYVHVSEKVLGPTGCKTLQNRLAVDAVCERQ